MNNPPRIYEIEGPSQEDLILYAEPFIGWRAWEVRMLDDEPRLYSFSYRTVGWEPGEELTAECRGLKMGHKLDHFAPNMNCGCGIHALREKEDALAWKDWNWPPTGAAVRCYGVVKIWGVVYHYTRGFLAQHAYPSKLWIDHITPDGFPCESRELVRYLRRTYRGVEVRLA